MAFSLIAEAQSKVNQISIKNAETGIYQKKLGRNRLLGDVIFEHDGALMYCDSAWLFSKENRIRAFQNVRINQGDSIRLWGDYLDYSGNTSIAHVVGEEVRLEDNKMKLSTTQLDFNRSTNLAYYNNFGTITNEDNVLTSIKGYYNSKSKVFNFKDSVVLVNPDYVIESDTLTYSSASRITYFLGPTTITSDSSFIYCENGRYNTITNIAQFEKNAYIYNQNKYLTGDSLYYEKATEFGEAFGAVLLHDTIEHYTIVGGYGQYTGATDSTFVTLDPIYSVKQESDTLHIHGDTLFSVKLHDSIHGSYRLLKIYRKVKFFKNDLQGKCDSLSYASHDSLVKMFYSPVIWNDSSQVTGDTIYLGMRNKKIDSLKVYTNAFILSLEDDDKKNQIKGRNMFGKFNDNKLRRVYVNGNGQTIYFPKDEEGSYIGMNKAECSNILIKLQKNKVEAITFLTKPNATLYPVNQSKGEIGKLEGYLSRFSERPQTKADILTWEPVQVAEVKEDSEEDTEALTEEP